MTNETEKTIEQIQAELERYYELLYDGVFDYLFEDEEDE